MTTPRRLFLTFTSCTKRTIHNGNTVQCTITTKSVHRIEVTKSICSQHCTQHRQFATVRNAQYVSEMNSILNGCSTLKDCYERIRNESSYIAVLSDGNAAVYSYQDHKYFILQILRTASKDKYLSWQMVLNVIEFYSKFQKMYNVPIESIYNFLSIFSRRGDFNAVSSIVDRLVENTESAVGAVPQPVDTLPSLPINHRLFTLLIQSLRIGGQSERGYSLFQQSLRDFDLQPSVPLLLQGYMVRVSQYLLSVPVVVTLSESPCASLHCLAPSLSTAPPKNHDAHTQCRPSQWNMNAISLLNQYNLFCDESAYCELIQFHLDCIIDQCQNTKWSQSTNVHRVLSEFDFDAIDPSKLPSEIQREYNHSRNEMEGSKSNPNISVENVLEGIQLNGQRVLFYLNHAHSSNLPLQMAIFEDILRVVFDYMLHHKLSTVIMRVGDGKGSSTNRFVQWIHQYTKHVLSEQLRNHSASDIAWKSNMSTLLPLLFEGCLNRNQVELSRDIWQLCESQDIEVDTESDKMYRDLSIRHFVRHGKRGNGSNHPNDSNPDASSPENKLAVFPGDCATSDLSIVPPPNDECFRLAQNLMDRAPKIAELTASNNLHSESVSLSSPTPSRPRRSYLIDMENAITFVRKYNDIVSARMLYHAFLASGLSFKYHAAMATDFLFVLDHLPFRHCIPSGVELVDPLTSNPLIITPEDVMTLWPLNPPQAFINKAFTILITYQHAEGIKKLFGTVLSQSMQRSQQQLQHQTKRLTLTPKMLILGSDLFAKQCESALNVMDNVYWEYLWNLLENKQFKSARTGHGTAYIGNKILNLLLHSNSIETEDVLMENVKRIHSTFKNYGVPLPLPLMQKLHVNLSNPLHKSWIRTVFIEQHHPDRDVSSIHLLNDWRWYIDADVFNQSLEQGLYSNLKPLRKLMIDGAIPVSHTLVHRILMTFSKCQDLDILEFLSFLKECQVHYQHAFSPKEKRMIVTMVRRHMTRNEIENVKENADLESMVNFLKSIQIFIGHEMSAVMAGGMDFRHQRGSEMTLQRQQRTPTQTQRESTPYWKHVNVPSAAPVMSDATRFEVGERVQLCGLQQYPFLNGHFGAVIGFFDKKTRTYPVRLDDHPHEVFVSARNMRFGKRMIEPTLAPLSGDLLLESGENREEMPLIPASSTSNTPLLLDFQPAESSFDSNSNFQSSNMIPEVLTNRKLTKNEITPFDHKQRKQHLRTKLLHIFEDQNARDVYHGISMEELKHLWTLYFPSEQFYQSDEELHDYVVMYVPFEIDYSWNVHQYPHRPLQRIYFLSPSSSLVESPKWQKIETLSQFLSYLRGVLGQQEGGRMRLKDLCAALYSDIYESHRQIRKFECIHILHFLNYHGNQFRIETINREKYVSLRNFNGDEVVDAVQMRHWDIYRVQYWLWELHQEIRHNLNLADAEWDVILGLFEGHRIDGNALLNLTESDLTRMGIVTVGVQKEILMAIPTSNNEDSLFEETDDVMVAPPQRVLSEKVQPVGPVNVEMEFAEMQNDDNDRLNITSSAGMALGDDNLYQCLLDYHSRFPSNDGYIHQNEVLQFYEMSGEHEWFVQHIVDYYYDKFHIKYEDDKRSSNKRMRTSIKLVERSSAEIQDVDDEDLRIALKRVVQRHPLGIDIISLLHEYQDQNDSKMFRRRDGMTLTDRLKALRFIVTPWSSGLIVFDAYR